MAQLHAWDVIVVTCRDEPTAGAYEKELKETQKKGLIVQSTHILAVADPDACVGSGGATLNALLVAAELLSSQDGYTAVTEDVLKRSEGRQARRILILHMGRDFPFDACCRAYTSIPGMWNVRGDSHLALSSVMTHLDYLLYMLNKICIGSPPGVWVSSSDMVLFETVPHQRTGKMIEWSDFNGGVMAVAIPGSKTYAKRHGVYRIGPQNEIRDIIYQGSSEQIESCSIGTDSVPVVSGIIFMCPSTASKLLDLQSEPPLENCTYIGIDSGNSPLNVSLYFDMLLSLAKDVCQEDYETGSRPGSYGHGSTISAGSSRFDDSSADRRRARVMVWRRLRHGGVSMQAAVLRTLEHDYIDLFPAQFIQRLQRIAGQKDVTVGGNSFSFRRVTQSFIQEGGVLADSSILVNCLCTANTTVKANSVMMHCRVEAPVEVSSGCLVNSVTFSSDNCKDLPTPLVVPENLAVISFKQRDDSGDVITCFGTRDELECPMENGTFYGKAWTVLFERTGIQAADLWPEGERKKTLLNARLFQCGDGALSNILWLAGSTSSPPGGIEAWRQSDRQTLAHGVSHADADLDFKRRSRLSAEIIVAVQRRALVTHKPISWVSSFRSTARGGHEDLLFEMLDDVAATANDPGVSARALAGIADVLAALAGDGTGLRSGPGGNKEWKDAYQQLQEANVAEGVKSLAKARQRWMNRRHGSSSSSQSSPLLRPRELLRAARHYEGAAQILISQAVKTAGQFAKLDGDRTLKPVAMGKWVMAEAPSRADIAGGWSDTPPITYENGGSVTNIAFLVNGKRPIGAKVKRIPEPMLRLCLVSSRPKPDEIPVVVECKELADMHDYCIPTARGALLKAAFYCMGVVNVQSSEPLSEQLMKKYEGGFELHTWSDLPAGSGLGTSSILAGVVISAIVRVIGHEVDRDRVTHLVLMVEQMLTTGGGWQDQAGGLFGGVKITRSPRQLPLKVEVTPLALKEEFLKEFDRRFVVIYTGRTRLARNILQEVIRSWYGQMPRIVNTARGLVSGSEECARAFLQGNLEKVGECMSRYWEQKKVMAYGCEPETVRQFMAALSPYVYGQSMAGAGGGGFMYVLMKEPDTGAEIVERVLAENDIMSFKVYGSRVDRDGLQITVEE